MNKLAIFGLVVLVLLGMTIAASTGVFLATSADPTAGESTATEPLDSVSLALLPEEEAELANLEGDTKAMPEGRMMAETGPADDESAVMLQEVRDAYISFPQAFPDVVVQYQNGPQCDGEPACVVADNEILVNRVWAKSAPRENIDAVLARQHATLAIDRAWANRRAARTDMESVLPSCLVKQDSKLYAEATKAEIPDLSGTENVSLAALSDVIINVMTGEKDAANIYPPQFHTPEQLKVAEMVALGERPEVVIPVSMPTCKD